MYSKLPALSKTRFDNFLRVVKSGQIITFGKNNQLFCANSFGMGVYSALLLSSCQKKQETEEGQLGCGFPALGDNFSLNQFLGFMSQLHVLWTDIFGGKMGLIYAKIELSNPKNNSVVPIIVKSLVDTGALHLCVPEHIAIQLELEELYKREVTTADAKKHLVPYVGPISLKFKNRACFTGALVLGDEVLLGAVSMEDMDVVVSPADQSLVVNPESPNIAMSIVK